MVGVGLDVIDITSRSFHTLIDNKTVLIYAAVGGIVSALFSAAFISQTTSLSALGVNPPITTLLPVLLSFLGAAAVGILVAFLINIFVSGSIISAAGSVGKLDAGDAAKRSVDRYVTLLITTVVEGIIVGIGFILFVIPGIFLAVRLSLAPVEVVVGKRGVVDSLQGSWNATAGNFWGILIILALVFIVASIISGLFGIVFTLIHLRPIASFISTFVSYSFTVAWVLMYQKIAAPAASRAGPRKKR